MTNDAHRSVREKAMREINRAVDVLPDSDKAQLDECEKRLSEIRDEYGWLGVLALSRLAVKQGGK
jgi:hypothetical protein